MQKNIAQIRVHNMGRRLCTLICAVFFCIFNQLAILIKYTKINIQKKLVQK